MAVVVVVKRGAVGLTAVCCHCGRCIGVLLTDPDCLWTCTQHNMCITSRAVLSGAAQAVAVCRPAHQMYNHGALNYQGMQGLQHVVW